MLEELYLLEVGLALRHAERAREPGVALDPARPGVGRGSRALPFRLTAAQQRAWRRDRAPTSREPHPMNRLLQGDVGQRQDRGGRARGGAPPPRAGSRPR